MQSPQRLYEPTFLCSWLHLRAVSRSPPRGRETLRNPGSVHSSTRPIVTVRIGGTEGCSSTHRAEGAASSRSRGRASNFVTQNPLDLPDEVLGQLGNRVQHALRAFTPRDRRAVKAAAETFRQNESFDVETAITELRVGEALVSTLGPKGAPSVVERTLVGPPMARVGPATDSERARLITTSPLMGRYDTGVDRARAPTRSSPPAPRGPRVRARRVAAEEEERVRERERACPPHDDRALESGAAFLIGVGSGASGARTRPPPRPASASQRGHPAPSSTASPARPPPTHRTRDDSGRADGVTSVGRAIGAGCWGCCGREGGVAAPPSLSP